MSLPYFFEPFSNAQEIMLSETTQHHLVHVLRMKIKEQFWLTNGKGTRCLMEINSVEKKSCGITLLDEQFINKAKGELSIAISFTKNPSRMEWFLEKATEIGIAHIIPLITKRSEKLHWKQDRFDKIIISAMLQSQQVYLPTLHSPTGLEEFLTQKFPAQYIAHCEENTEKLFLQDVLQMEQNCSILIGPEGDFTPSEIEQCLATSYVPVSLGKTRLRTETAGMVACTLFNLQSNAS